MSGQIFMAGVSLAGLAKGVPLFVVRLRPFLLPNHRSQPIVTSMTRKADVWRTLAVMVLKTLQRTAAILTRFLNPKEMPA
jgi:hypothetical protein